MSKPVPHPQVGEKVNVWPDPALPAGARVEEFPGSRRFLKAGQAVVWSSHLEARHRDGSLLLHDPKPAAPVPLVPGKEK